MPNHPKLNLTEKQLEVVWRRSLDFAFPNQWHLDKNHPDRFEGGGKSDFTGHVCGWALAVELKVSPNRPEPGQIPYLHQFARTGGYAGILLLHRHDGVFYWIGHDRLSDDQDAFSYKDRERLWFKVPHTKTRTTGGPSGYKEDYILNLDFLRIQLTMLYAISPLNPIFMMTR